MMKNVGPREVSESRKLIFTVHGYSNLFSTGWKVGENLPYSGIDKPGKLNRMVCGFFLS